MEYFIIRNFGYDGFDVSKYATRKEAENSYLNGLYDIHLHPDIGDKGIVFIEGTIVKSEDVEEVF